MKRISVIRDEKLVPLFPGASLTSSVRPPLGGPLVEAHELDAAEFPEHIHSTYCLAMHLCGPVEQEWWCGGRNGKQSYRTGSMCLVARGTQHRTYSSSPSRQLVLSIEESDLLRAARDMGKTRVTVLGRLCFEDRQIYLLMSEFQREMESGWETGALYLEHLGLSLSIALIQKFSDCRVALPVLKGGMTRVRLQRVLEYLAENQHRDLSLTDLAEVADLSPFHFARLFRSEMGMTPHRYLIDQRLERAKEMLRCDRGHVADIALETGFKSSGHFSRAFRRHVGASPSDWKRQA
jgi:AraC family transcriptional regulator